MFSQLVLKKKIPIQRRLVRRKPNKKEKMTNFRFWVSASRLLKDNETWLDEWRIHAKEYDITFDHAPTQEEAKESAKKAHEEELRFEKESERLRQVLETRRKAKETRRKALDAEAESIARAAAVVRSGDHSRMCSGLKTLFEYYDGIMTISVPVGHCLPDEDFSDNKTHHDIRRTQIDNTGRGEYRRVRRSPIRVNILVPKGSFNVGKLKLGNQSSFGDFQLGEKVCECEEFDFKSTGSVVKSGLYTVVKGKGHHDYLPRWYSNSGAKSTDNLFSDSDSD